MNHQEQTQEMQGSPVRPGVIDYLWEIDEKEARRIARHRRAKNKLARKSRMARLFERTKKPELFY